MSGQVRVCLVGAGRAARVHANSLVRHVPDAKLVAVVDVLPESLNKLAETYEIGGRYASLEEALGGEKFDAVVIDS